MMEIVKEKLAEIIAEEIEPMSVSIGNRLY